jgi:hypothetical protein
VTRTVRYAGGPLDGQELDATDWSDEDLADGGYEIVPCWGPERADYAPDPDGDPLIWRYRGPVAG